jgi:hypothetical protein
VDYDSGLQFNSQYRRSGGLAARDKAEADQFYIDRTVRLARMEFAGQAMHQP